MTNRIKITLSLVGAALLAVIYFSLDASAASSLQSAPKAAIECLNRCFETASGDPMQCSEQLRDDLGVALWWPSTKQEALQRQQDLRYSAIEHALSMAASVSPNAAKRDQLSAELLSLSRRSPRPRSSYPPIVDVYRDGAFLVAQRASAETNESSLSLFFSTGDLEALNVQLSNTPAQPSAGFTLRRAAWLCLLNQTKEGMALLTGQYDEKNVDDESLVGHLSMILCGDESSDFSPQPRHYSADFFHAARALRSPSDDSQFVASELGYFGDQLPRLTRALPRVSTLEQFYRLLSADIGTPNFSEHTKRATQLYRTFAITDLLEPRMSPVSPEAIEASASRIAALAAQRWEQADLDAFKKEIDLSERWMEALLIDPPRYIRDFSFQLWQIAANKRIVMGQLSEARAALAQAELVASQESLPLLAPLYLLAGDPQRAVTILANAKEDPQLLYWRAFGYAKLEQWEEAYQDALRAWSSLVNRGEGPQRPEIAWLLAGLAWKANHHEPLPGLPPAPPVASSKVRSDPLQMLSFLWSALQKTEAERRIIRLHLAEIDTYPLIDVLPVVMYLVGELAHDAGDIEVWLNRAFASEHTRQGYEAAVAREEAARWRGEQDAMLAWGRVLAAVRALAPEMRSMLLLAVAQRGH